MSAVSADGASMPEPEPPAAAPESAGMFGGMFYSCAAEPAQPAPVEDEGGAAPAASGDNPPPPEPADEPGAPESKEDAPAPLAAGAPAAADGDGAGAPGLAPGQLQITLSDGGDPAAADRLVELLSRHQFEILGQQSGGVADENKAMDDAEASADGEIPTPGGTGYEQVVPPPTYVPPPATIAVYSMVNGAKIFEAAPPPAPTPPFDFAFVVPAASKEYSDELIAAVEKAGFVTDTFDSEVLPDAQKVLYTRIAIPPARLFEVREDETKKRAARNASTRAPRADALPRADARRIRAARAALESAARARAAPLGSHTRARSLSPRARAVRRGSRRARARRPAQAQGVLREDGPADQL